MMEKLFSIAFLSVTVQSDGQIQPTEDDHHLTRSTYVLVFRCESVEAAQTFAENVLRGSEDGSLAESLTRKAGSRTVTSARVVGQPAIEVLASEDEATGTSKLFIYLCGGGLAALVLLGVVIAAAR
eukprot:scaffold16937_cov35-Prasinocladus_malaysianus.AAC.1